ncbi:PREDICTED: neuroblastoma breakpoint family member 4-like [Cercocebus atys]|uniref:neuroblastoma breakpoint family member 4-like n=1 Tax=Cercocebus atys TaxID=9531 RepID=UPI0005F56AAD|nr:PREDICTED: neuroblastoma breakpoint family member 4-like [Cercocebus atys]
MFRWVALFCMTRLTEENPTLTPKAFESSSGKGRVCFTLCPTSPQAARATFRSHLLGVRVKRGAPVSQPLLELSDVHHAVPIAVQVFEEDPVASVVIVILAGHRLQHEALHPEQHGWVQRLRGPLGHPAPTAALAAASSTPGCAKHGVQAVNQLLQLSGGAAAVRSPCGPSHSRLRAPGRHGEAAPPCGTSGRGATRHLRRQDPWTGGRKESRGPFGERERVAQQARKGPRGCEILAMQTQCLPKVTAAGDMARSELLRRALMPASSTLRALRRARITDGIGQHMEMVQQDEECEEYKDIIDSVLRDELQFVEKLAEKLRQAEELGQYKALVHSQARELTQLREKLQEGRDASRSLNQHFKALLAPDDLEKSQGQDLREQLAEGHRLAEHLVHKLSPENDEDEDEDEMDEEVEKVQESPAPREVQKAEEKEVPQNSLEECAVTCSNSHNPSNSNQPHKSTKITFEENKVDSALVVESERFHDEEEEALTILPENQNDHEEEEGKAPVPPRQYDMSNYYLHSEVSFLALNEEKVCSTQDVAKDYSNSKWDETSLGFLEQRNDLEEVKGQETIDPRLSRGLLRVDKHEVPQESLDGCCLTPSILPELPHSYCPYGSTSYCFEEKQVSLAHVDKIQKDQEEVEDQDPPCPRLSQELPEVKEQEMPEDSVDEVYLTPSVHHDLSDCHQPYSSTLYSLEDQFACSALDGASHNQADCPQGTWSGDLSHHLSEVQASQAQLEPSTLAPNCLRPQLDQGFYYGNDLARRGPSSTTCSFAANADSGNQRPFQGREGNGVMKI